MRFLDDTASPEHVSRRRFFSLAALGAMGTTLLGTMAICVRFLRPAVLFELPTRFRALRVSELARRKVQFIRDRKVFVVQDDRGVFAMSAVCTHLGCLTRPEASGVGFFCPCHGSRFRLDGKVAVGPAPKPLPHVQAELVGDTLWVDTARRKEDSDERIHV